MEIRLDFPQNWCIFAYCNDCPHDMKLLYSIILTLSVCTASNAQNLAIGERTPPMHLKFRHWVNGHTPPECGYTYIGFVHSASIPCIRGIEHVEKILAGKDNVRLLVLTKEPEKRMSAWLERLAGGRSGVACDCEYPFRSFGVNYAPFGVIIDCKRRVLWFGNPKQLTEEYLMKLTNNKNTKCRSRK